jgi:hypothetical protein
VSVGLAGGDGQASGERVGGGERAVGGQAAMDERRAGVLVSKPDALLDHLGALHICLSI